MSPDLAGGPGYLLAGAGFDAEQARLASLAAAADPMTIDELAAIGAGPGWDCLEVGAGTGTVARWLAGQVLPGGRVVATDIDTRFLGELTGPGIEVRRQDIVADDLPARSFDLVHARFVLMHLGSAAGQATVAMARALRPGGWLVLEETDSLTHALAGDDSEEARFLARTARAHWRLLARAGVRPDIGRELPAMLRAAGLTGISARGVTESGPGGSPVNAMLARTISAFRRSLARAGFTGREIDRCLALLRDPAAQMFSPLRVIARGRAGG